MKEKVVDLTEEGVKVTEKAAGLTEEEFAKEMEDCAWEIKFYNTKQLIGMYQVSRKKFSSMIKNIKDELGKREGYSYNPRQVKIIFKRWSPPPPPKKKELKTIEARKRAA